MWVRGREEEEEGREKARERERESERASEREGGELDDEQAWAYERESAETRTTAERALRKVGETKQTPYLEAAGKLRARLGGLVPRLESALSLLAIEVPNEVDGVGLIRHGVQLHVARHYRAAIGDLHPFHQRRAAA